MKNEISRTIRTFFIFFQALIVIVTITGCSSGPKHLIQQPPSVPPVPSRTADVLYAGAAEVDITPPPGLPLWGHPAATSSATGYWTRLKVHTIVFQDRTGKRTALVQLDWGTVSSLLHRTVAHLLASEGFTPANLLLAATHTHAAPGGTFGAANYNKFGGRSGYFPQLVEWLAGHIVDSVKKAVKDLAPAGIAAGVIRAKKLSRNRSIEAWKLNFKGNPPDIYHNGVIPDLHVLRVDHVGEQYDGGSLPIAAFVIAPLHATAVEHKNKLYHGDLHGVASRYLTAFITENKKYKHKRRFVAAVVAGPQGDVSPEWSKADGQSISEAKRLGRLLAQKAYERFESLDAKSNTKNILLQYSYGEFFLPGARVGKTRSLAMVPEMGKAAFAGAEDGRSPLNGRFGIREGVARIKPKGDHGYKKSLPKFIIRLATNPKFWPKITNVQVIRLGNVLTLGSVPGEPTTESGRRINNALARHTDTQTAIVALANGYISYIATPEEYKAQHFEGGMTRWGPNELEFFVEKISIIAANLNKETTDYSRTRRFLTGRHTYLYNRNGHKGNPSKWKPYGPLIKKWKNNRLSSVRFNWLGLNKKYLPGTLPTISIEYNGSVLKGPEGMAETDHGLHFIVKRKGKNLWSATWTPPEGIPTDTRYRFKISYPDSPDDTDFPEMAPFYSEEFQLENK